MLHIIPRSERAEGDFLDRKKAEENTLTFVLGILIATVIIVIMDFLVDFANGGSPSFGLFILETIWLLFLLTILLGMLSPMLEFLIMHLHNIYLWIFDRNEYINQKNILEESRLRKATQERNRIARERRKQSEFDRKWNEKKRKTNQILRELTENIFSDIRAYDLYTSTHKLKIKVFIGGDTRAFIYRDIYHMDIEDIEREMKADKISPKPRPRYRSSRYYDGASDVGDSGSDLGDTMDE